jgi:peptide/nickel transport system substrate-binding protein
VQPVPAAELARRRSSGAFALLLDVVRPLGAPGLATLLALATADDRAAAIALARRPPRLASFAPRTVTRGLRLGVVGELRVFGAAAPEVKLAASPAGEGWDLGASFRARVAAVPG